MNRRERLELIATLSAVAVAAVCRYAELGHVLTFVVAAIALGALAHLVGTATEQLGSRRAPAEDWLPCSARLDEQYHCPGNHRADHK